MGPFKSAIVVLLLNAAITASAVAAPLLDLSVSGQTIFSDTYTTTGANSSVFGSVLAGGVLTTGDNAGVFGNLISPEAVTTGGGGSTVSGSIVSGDVATAGNGSLIGGNLTASGAATIGDHSQVAGYIIADGVLTTGDTSRVGQYAESGGAASVGANGVVGGAVQAVGLISISASAKTGSPSVALTTAPFVAVDATKNLVKSVNDAGAAVTAAQNRLNALGSGTVLAATMTTSQTLTPGVYSAPSFSTTDGIVLTLNGNNLPDQVFVFNIADILSFGANSKIVLENFGAGSSVIWNSSGYTTTGDSAVVIGTILSNTYIAIGANANVTGVGANCGGVYSATSYVSTGDSAKVGSKGCTVSDVLGGVGNKTGTTNPTVPVVVKPIVPPVHGAVPEPATWAMMLIGLGLVGQSIRRRSALVAA